MITEPPERKVVFEADVCAFKGWRSNVYYPSMLNFDPPASQAVATLEKNEAVELIGWECLLSRIKISFHDTPHENITVGPWICDLVSLRGVLGWMEHWNREDNDFIQTLKRLSPMAILARARKLDIDDVVCESQKSRYAQLKQQLRQTPGDQIPLLKTSEAKAEFSNVRRNILGPVMALRQ